MVIGGTINGNGVGRGRTFVNFDVDANPKISISILAACLSSEVRYCKTIDFRIKRLILVKIFAPAARRGRLRRGAGAGS